MAKPDPSTFDYDELNNEFLVVSPNGERKPRMSDGSTRTAFTVVTSVLDCPFEPFVDLQRAKAMIRQAVTVVTPKFPASLGQFP
jgi:hypothetical protein